MSMTSPEQPASRESQPDSPEELHRFAWFPLRGHSEQVAPGDRGRIAWTDALQELRNIAEPEEWAGRNAEPGTLPILSNYLRYTYQRLVQEKKIGISADGEVAAFNTGLLTPFGQEIFALFTRNTKALQPWVFMRWANEAHPDLLRHFDPAPEMARFFQNAVDLIYDPDRVLRPDYEHILNDHPERLTQRLAGAGAPLKQALDNAIAVTTRRVKRNYKIVVPQWYPKAPSGTQFLFPLDLTGDGSADAALAVEAIGNYYRAMTVLDLDMAYSNARLIARPNSEWLLPAAPVQLGQDYGPTDLE